jgi:hypothetical protein
MENVDVLDTGSNKYTKIKYTPLQTAEQASRYIAYISSKNIEELEKLYLSALKKVYVNGTLLDSELKLNEHFAKFPGDLRAVRLWALQEGFQSFLESSSQAEEAETKYYGI